MHGTMHGTSSPVHRCRDDGEKTNRIQREKITHACIDLLPGQAANKNNAYLNPFAALPTADSCAKFASPSSRMRTPTIANFR